MLTKVIFRQYSDGDIIALFPEIPASESRGDCLSYMHLGQHGTANYNLVIDQTHTASEEQSMSLIIELNKIGYELKIYQKQTPEMRKNFEQAYREMRDVS